MPTQLKLVNFLSMEEGSSKDRVLCCHAQVENMQALQNFDSIVAAADAVVLSRGNLGLDVAPEKTAVVQKAAINRCNLQGKPVIITRLVDTMVEAPRCTRHAVTDQKLIAINKHVDLKALQALIGSVSLLAMSGLCVGSPLPSVRLHAQCATVDGPHAKHIDHTSGTCLVPGSL